jgi:FtsP/CotA-like multicopper oxidase with cupredoxin domain
MHTSSFLSVLSFASVTFAAQVKFQLNVTWAQSSLVGTPKQQFLLNGQSPGPPLDITVGDSVEFEVVNSSPYNTTVHFHGITQLGTVSHFPRLCTDPMLTSCSHGPMVFQVYRNTLSSPARTSHTSGRLMSMANTGITPISRDRSWMVSMVPSRSSHLHHNPAHSA